MRRRWPSLHGLGEARQVAEDLIADIRAAQTGVLRGPRSTAACCL
jgi:hypothetical protein